jgi:hypothetical protein
MDMSNSAVNLGSGGYDIRYMQEGGMPLSSSLRPRLRPENLRGPGPGMISPTPEFTEMYPEERERIFGKQGRGSYGSDMLEGGGDLRFYDNGVPLDVDEALDRRNPATGLEFGDEAIQPLRERGMGAVLYDAVFGGLDTKGISKSARPGSERYEEFYVEGQPDFQDQLIEQFDYPYVEDPETGDLIIPTDPELYSEKERTERTRVDMPAYQEIEDARGHMLGSALLSKEYGPKTAAKVGGIGEFMDFALSGSNRRDVDMDTRNNAIGRQIFMKAGIDATPQEITRLVDAEIFKQLDVIMGRSEDEQGAVAEDQPRAPANFKSPPTGPAVFYPRDEEGFYDTKRDGYKQYLD